MSDESAQETIEQKETPQDEKQTNRTFDQSEVDRLIAREKAKEREKYADYSDMKAQLEQLAAEKKKMQEAEMSEIEKLTSALTEKEQAIAQMTQENLHYKQAVVKQNVLNNTKYAQLPRAYKELVKVSDKEEDVVKSADEALEEFLKDTGKTVSQTFGVKQVETKDNVISASPEDLAGSIRGKLRAKLEGMGAL